MSSAATTRWGSARLLAWRAPSPADQLSVIWIDAHTDINTNLTSPSHNIHGMPLAAALGLGDSRLYENMGAQAPFLLPENLFYIGTRSVDPGEEEILAAHNIRTVRMPEIREKGIELCARELLDAVKTPYIHLSFDVDFLDAGEFWATGLPIPDGPSVEEAHQVIRTLFQRPARLLGGLCGVQPPARHRRQRTFHLSVAASGNP